MRLKYAVVGCVCAMPVLHCVRLSYADDVMSATGRVNAISVRALGHKRVSMVVFAKLAFP